MSVSFIVPLYNGLEFTKAMLASLQATLPRRLDHEVILVDNGSTDGTREWLQTLRSPNISFILNDRNLGYAAANNLAASEAESEFLALLNNDLVLLPGWLEPMLKLANGPATGIVGNVQLSVRTRQIDHAGVFFDPDGQPVHFRPSTDFLTRHSSLSAPAVTGACMIMRRSLFTELGGFDEGYASGYEDIDLCLRARAGGHNTVVSLRSVVYHHIGASEGRHDNDESNAARFKTRWDATAHELARIEPPQNSKGESAAASKLPFNPESFATLQAFHPTPSGHSEQASSVHLYPTAHWERVSVPLPRGLSHEGVTVRLDPCNFPATVRVAALVLRERASRKIIWSLRGAGVSKILQVGGTAAVQPESDRWLTVVSTGPDPQLGLRLGSIPFGLERRTDLALELWLHTSMEK